MLIRPETSADRAAIDRINRDAFGGDEEARLIERLRACGIPLISRVAEQGQEIIGHILFSPVTLTNRHPADLRMVGLAPMAVAPHWQNQGVGSELVRRGLEACTQAGYDAVVVLGHPNYYPRFGFVPSIEYGLRSTYEVPAEVFMIKELRPGVLKGISGVIQYHPSFNEP